MLRVLPVCTYTNYEGKAQAAINALKTKDFVYLHIEASDEAGHEGDVELKTKTIEYLDQRVVKYILEETQKMNEPVAIAVYPIIPHPVPLKTHTREAVHLIYTALICNPMKWKCTMSSVYKMARMDC
jgi:2,3-bisphosphoglycerate-independent phosphoglycerate mutase